MKKLILIITVLLVTVVGYSQENEEAKEVSRTKMQRLSSKTGLIIKRVDFNLLPIKASFGSYLNTRIRKVTTSSSSTYFYQIEKVEERRTRVASIE